MSGPHEPSADLPRADDELMPFYAFMLAFWPVSIVLGLIDFYLVTGHDLRLYVLLAGLVAGGITMQAYRAKRKKEQEAA
jgi:hypothetical protein